MATKVENEEVFLIADAAGYLKLSVQYLYQSRHAGKGPKCEMREMHGLGRGPRMRLTYTKSALDEWDRVRKEKKNNTKKKASAKKKAGSKKKLSKAA